MASARNPLLGGSAATSRVSLASEVPSSHATPAATGRNTPTVIGAAESKYSISAVLAEPQQQSSILPALPSLPSASSYLPSQLSSLSTTFTSAGTLPRAAEPGVKSVAQRRSQAPPIHVTELRKVNKSEFDGYLREVGDHLKRWQRESRLGREGAADLRDVDGRLSGEDDAHMPGLGMGASPLLRSPALPPPGSTEVLPSLDDVPQIFFDASFDLANPRTFDLVTERIQLSPHPSPNLSLPAHASSSTSVLGSLEAIPGLGPHTLNDLAADQVLQDKLSHYTAVIESHLVREIGLRSSSFFAALSNLQSLHQEGEAALGKISELQSALAASEGGVGSTAQHGLQILRAQARRRGLEHIEEAVRAVEEVWTAVEGVKELVENGEWDGALEVSEQIEEAYYGSSASAGDEAPASSPLSPAKSPARRRMPSRPTNLTKLRALSSLPGKLALLRAQIAKSLEGELISVLEHEMDVGIDEHVQLAREGRRWKGKARAHDPPLPARVLQDVPEEEVSEADEDMLAPEERARERALERVRPVVSALARAEGMDSAVTAWRESVLREVRALVREHLPTAETPTAEEEDHFAQVAIRSVSRGASVDLGTISEKSVSLAKKLRALSHAAFLALARDTYAGLLACIEVVDLQSRVLLELWSASRQAEQRRKARRRGRSSGAAEEAVKPAPASSSLAVPGSTADLAVSAANVPSDSSRSSTSDDASSLAIEIADVVHVVAELANVRFSKVIGVRTEVHAHLALAEFVEIFDLSWTFVVQCELICQRMIVGLRGAMVSQAKTFLQTFHQRQITENARVVEEEQWAAAEVPPETQANVKLIVDSATSDPPELLLGERRAAWEAHASNGEGDGAVHEPAKQVDVEGRGFFAVSAGLVTIAVLVEYLKVLVNIPMLTTDAMSKIIEFMKVFNSRTCQVVLGAGAMRSAGLKNITAKHLALASQALSIMIALIPYIREAVRRHLNPKQAVMLTEFDKLKRDYQEHQYEIHAKLVAIMSDRLQVHSRTLEGVNFEEPAPRPDAPNAYMEALVKEHNTLYKVLSRFLATETVAGIMGQVFAALDARLGEVFARVEPRSQTAKDRMFVDVRYIRDRLGGLKGMEENGPGKDLEALLAAKSVPQAPAPPPAPVHAPAVAPAVPSTPKPSLPPRTTSIAPPSSSPFASPALSTTAPGLGPAPAQPIYADARASTSSTSLSSATTIATIPRPPSPVPVPAALPPSPKPAAPAPYVSRKKKSLAERLAESMGRKAALAEAGVAREEAGVAREEAGGATAAAAVPAPARASNGEPAPAPPADEAPSELTPLALERAFENGHDVSTPALEQALKLEGIEVAAGGLATPAREELENVEKAVEREIAHGTDGEADALLEALPDASEPAPSEGAEVEQAAVDSTTAGETSRPTADANVLVAVDDPVEAQEPIGDPLVETAALDRDHADERSTASATEPSTEPVLDTAVEPVADTPAHIEVAQGAEPTTTNPLGSGPEPEAPSPVAPEVPATASESPLHVDDEPAELLVEVSTVEQDEGENTQVAASEGEPVSGEATASAELHTSATDSGDADARAEAPDAAGEAGDSVQVATAPELPRPVPVVQSTTAATAEAPVIAAPAEAKTGEIAPGPALASRSTSPDALPPPAPVADAAPPPSAAAPSASAEVARSSSASPTPAPAPAGADSAAPPRRKTLKERLAEAARRASSGGSGPSAGLSSPPVSPTAAAPAAAPSPAAVLQSNGAGRESVVASPEAVTSALPLVPVVDARETKESEMAVEKAVEESVEVRKEEEDSAVVAEEEEESSFL